MKRWAVALLVSSLVLGLLVPVEAHSARAKDRIEKEEYLGGGLDGQLYLNAQGQFNTGAVRLSGSAHRYLSVDISDMATGSVVGEIAQGKDASGGPQMIHRFCGSTQKPVKIAPNVEVLIFINNGTCDGGVSIVTAGEVEARFSVHRR